MNHRRILAITRRILQQFKRDRRTLALLFVVPLVVLSLLYFLLRGSAPAPEVGVVNLDGGPLGALLSSRLQTTPGIHATVMDRAAAEAGLRREALAGYILLPAGLSEPGSSLAPEIHLEGGDRAVSTAVLEGFARAAAGTRPERLRPRISQLHGGPGLDTLDYFAGAFLGMVVFFLVFVVTCVSFLRERSQGTLERLLASPLRRPEIVAGYMLGFTVVALVQAAVVLAFSLAVLKVHNGGSVALVFGLLALMALAAVNLGIFLSMFARTEFQAVQFIPLVIAPQMLLSGVIFPVSSEPRWLQAVSQALPLTYAVSGLRDVMIRGADLGRQSVQVDLTVMLGVCLLLVVAAAATLRRRLG